MAKFPSPEWATAYKDAINQNAAYREAGKDWVHGPVAMVVKADPAIGLAEDQGFVLALHQGVCNEAEYVTGLEKANVAPFVIVGDYARWKQVVRGELEPIKGMMQGKLKLTKGHMPTIVKFVEASKQLVASSARVPTQFLDE
ncbi:MAG: SCP2 sterol-binding domain-containing protein [Deltaproteobacteria bacterium]|nr:SCP2 sterol-binding domain-containing protein [Deltaproteobacteria bacterium]